MHQARIPRQVHGAGGSVLQIWGIHVQKKPSRLLLLQQLRLEFALMDNQAQQRPGERQHRTSMCLLHVWGRHIHQNQQRLDSGH